MQNIALTTPLYYVNASPHIGSSYTNILCDTYIRWNKLIGNNTVFLTGVDEHGGKIEKTALDNNISPQEHCNNISNEFLELWNQYDIEYNIFSRTSNEHHKKFVATFFNKCLENGDIYEGEYTGLYCLACEDFKNERELENNNICPIHKTKVEEYKEKNYFFALSKYTDRINDFLDNNKDFIKPNYRINEIKHWLNEGLKDFPISRKSVKWGVPLPIDSEQTIYVWFDALLGYLSPLVKNPESLDELKSFEGYIHVVGKDILRFHAVYWLAMLMSAGLPLPKQIAGHGFLTRDGQKMGKTLGNIINPLELLEQYGIDAIRFYFLFYIPFGADGDFTNASFIELNNSYLANRLGNIISRVFKLFDKNMNMTIPLDIDWSSDREIAKKTKNTIEKVNIFVKDFALSEAITEIFNLIDYLNLELSEVKPWTLLKSDNANDHIIAKQLLSEIIESIRIIANLLSAFLPNISSKILALYGLDNIQSWDNINIWGQAPNLKFEKLNEILFARIEE